MSYNNNNRWISQIPKQIEQNKFVHLVENQYLIRTENIAYL